MSPVYAYKCPKCDLSVIEDRYIDDRDNLTECVDCKVLMKRLLNFGSVAFRGSGFYSTDK